MATTTATLGLRKPATTDTVNVTTDISDNMDLLDAAVAARVAKSLFDANTILAATTDDTPAALTVGASTVVGRRAAGGIVAISYANLLSDLGAAPLASPAFTGTPTAPTQAANDNSTKLATTAYVDTGLTLKANLASPTFTGTPAAPTAAQGTNTTQLATTAMVQSEVTLLAPKASPTFTGTVNVAALTASGLITANAGLTLANGQALTLGTSTITGTGAASFGAITGTSFTGTKFAADTSGRAALGIAIDATVLFYVNQTHPSNSASLFGIYSDVTFPTTATGTVKGVHLKNRITAGSQTVASNYGIDIQSPTVGAGVTVTDTRGITVGDQGNTLTQTATGIYVGAQRNSTVANIGVRIDAALNTGAKTLWISGNTDSIVAAAGIYFGASGDTTLYRSAASTLKTDGALAVGGNFAANGVAPAALTTFTQTYSTQSATVGNMAAAAVATTPAALASYGYTQAQADAIVTALNNLITDVTNSKKNITSIIDALQASGLAL